MKSFYMFFLGAALGGTGCLALAQSAPQIVKRVDRSALMQRAVVQQRSASRASWEAPTPVPAEGDIKIPVLLVEFTDIAFTVASNPVSDFNEHCNGEQGSVGRYYRDASENHFRPQFDVYGPKKLSHAHSYYGKNNDQGYDSKLGELVKEATGKFDSDVNFSNYDNDGDGVCDAVIVLFAGPCDDGYDDAGNYLGACHFDMAASEYGQTVKRDGVDISAFAIFNEQAIDPFSTSFKPLNRMEGIGCFVHEFGHCMGLPDLYQVNTHAEDNYEVYNGMGWYDVMAYGTYGGPDSDSSVPVGYSAYEKNFLGWMDLDTPVDGTTYTLRAHNDSNTWGESGRAFKITKPGNDDEYFILENRQLEGWDQYIGFVSKGGLLITHVVYDEYAWRYNEVNDYSLQRVTVVEAEKNEGLFPGYNGNKKEFSATSKPVAEWADGTTLALPIVNITRNADKTVSFGYGSAAGIDDIEADTDEEPSGPVRYFDLTGREVANPSNGLYIRLQGTRASKVVLR